MVKVREHYTSDTFEALSSRTKWGICIFPANCRSLTSFGMTISGRLKS